LVARKRKDLGPVWSKNRGWAALSEASWLIEESNNFLLNIAFNRGFLSLSKCFGIHPQKETPYECVINVYMLDRMESTTHGS
jgi:hypothetical protein